MGKRAKNNFTDPFIFKPKTGKDVAKIAGIQVVKIVF
jgi:hypothetical protein